MQTHLSPLDSLVELSMPQAPRTFVSYSHDDQPHKDWVLRLSDRLVRNGVDVILDQWDLRIGSDLPSFMEAGLVDSDRVIAVCSENYVNRANSGAGGVGYEKMILTGQLMRNVASTKIVPIIRNNTSERAVPTFLSTRVYVDFRNEDLYEQRYAELLREIHGFPVTARPVLGPNPFVTKDVSVEPRTAFDSARYVMPGLSGTVIFDYSNNDGRFVVGNGDMLFETHWSRAGTDSIHAYNDAPSIRSIAIADGKRDFSELEDVSIFDNSSRVRSPQRDEIVIWQNTAGYYLATKINYVRSRGHGAAADEISFTYAIARNKEKSFAN
jgi:hypothetical protein